MGMSTGGGGSNLNNDMNVTPMIDVVMCLIIFYLMVGHLASGRRPSNGWLTRSTP